MSKILPIKPPLPSKPKVAAKASTRRHCAPECATYTHPSDDYMLDHMLHAAAAKVTGGLSPASLALGLFDWWEHLLFSPSKQQMLGISMMNKTSQMGNYAMRASNGMQAAPIITPPPADRRFNSDGWKACPTACIANICAIYS